MDDSEIIALIRSTIRFEVAQMLLASQVSTESTETGTIQRFSTDSAIPNVGTITPYGFVSRPPAGTTSVVSPINGDPSNLVNLGQFDKGNRPAIQSGEVAVYGPKPHAAVIYLDTNGNIKIGSLVAASPLVLGDILKNFCDDIITTLVSVLNAIATGPIATTTSPGSPAPTYPALAATITNAVSQINSFKSQYVDTAATNFVSQSNFTERNN